MKIAFVAQPFDQMTPPVRTGSLALWIYYTAQELVRRGHDATVIGNNGTRICTVRVVHDAVKYVMTPTLVDDYLNRIGLTFARLRNLVAPRKFLYIYSSWYHSLFSILAARSIAKEKFDVVHIMNYSQFVSKIRRQNPKATIILHMHCEWLTQFPSDVMVPRLQQVDLIVGCSDYITGLIVDKFPQFTQKCITVPNAADIPSNGQVIEARSRRVLFVGRLSPEKGIHDLIIAFREVLKSLPDATLHLVGSPGSVPLEYLVGLSADPRVQALRIFYERPASDSMKDPYLEAIEELAGPELGKRIILEGYADHHLIQEHYAKATVLVNPSLSESFGISLIEAMMMKLPVVATRVGGMQHTVVEGQTGFLVDAASPQSLARAICDVLTNPEAARKMGESGYARARERFSWKSVTDKLLSAYDAALKHGALR